MAIPEYPITRREQYLDAIATNDTSVLPAEPITRTEQYLDAIARNGGGGGGSSGGVLVVHVDVDGTLDKTWQEIHDADAAIVSWGGDTEKGCEFVFYNTNSGGFSVLTVSFDDSGAVYPNTYIADSANGYPVLEGD